MRQILRLIFPSLLLLVLNQAYATDLKEIEQEITDSVITTKITAKYTKYSELNPLKISVSTSDGIVSLSGFVDDKEMFITALRLAKATRGVKYVDADELEIKRVNTTLTDAYITAKVEAAVLKAKVLDDETIPLVGISASTTNGVVRLSGKVKYAASIDYILNRVYAVQGVIKIISTLEVSTKS